MNFLVAVAQSPRQWDVLSTWGADLVNCCTFLHPLGKLGGGRSNWTLPTLQVHYVQLWVSNCLPLLEKLYPLPSPLLCDLNTVARPCYLSLRSQMACEQIFKPADHLREGTSPCKLKGQAPHMCTPTVRSLRFFVHHCTRSSKFPDPACHSKLLSYAHRAWGLGSFYLTLKHGGGGLSNASRL